MGPEPRPTVLVVEDEAAITDALQYAFELEGFAFESASTGRAGLEAARRLRPSVVVLDVMLPGMSGLDVCRQLRSESDVPIIMLTARGAEADKVAGLELGADDYLTKPFSMRELVARVRAQVRRSARGGNPANAAEVLRGGSIELDVDAHEVRLDGAVVELRPKEFDLLESLMRRPGRLATREALIDEVWGPDHFGATKTLDVHIKRLRDKLESTPSRPRHIVTVRGLGYKFVD
ncbi:MAG TPA: response regulator transcription factor [Acidimicrobiia bacterium]|jgi:two-component system response regulator RegX3|nr:response regulator transcription factor [Acidimicrobiia bacterium]